MRLRKILSLIVLPLMVTGSAWSARDAVRKMRFDVLMDRAKTFERIGLFPLAYEQVNWLLKVYPDNKAVKKELKELSGRESQFHFHNALTAYRVGARRLALLEVNRALKSQPQDGKAKKLKAKIMEENDLKAGLTALVERDYLEGLNHYQNHRLREALESFVKVLNMDPNHKDAQFYLQKIGQELGVSK